MNRHGAALAACLVLTAGGHLFLKVAASSVSRPVTRLVAAGAGFSALASVVPLAAFAMQVFDLKTVSAWSAGTQVLVFAGAVGILGERPDARTSLGAALIVLGIVVFHL